jgi:DNA-binding NtrC family response regulator
MGVNGFALLEACRERKLPAAMLTAHAINVESLNLAIKLGAVSFLPKEELARLPEIVAEIFEGLEQGQSHWKKLFQRLGPFFKEKLGILWEDLDQSKFPTTYY